GITSSERAGAQRPERAETKAQRTPELSSEERSLAVVVLAATAAVAVLVAVAGWILVAFLIARTAGEPMGQRGAALLAWMAGALAALLILRMATSIRLGTLSLFGSYYAALAAALVFAGYRAAHATPGGIRPSRDWLTWRCLAWAACGALVVGYWDDNLWV